MLGLSSGLIKGTSVLRSIVKKGLQAWYKADDTQAPLGEEEIVNGSFDIGPDIIGGDMGSFFAGSESDKFSYNSGLTTVIGDSVKRVVKDGLLEHSKSYKVTVDVVTLAGINPRVYLGGSQSSTLVEGVNVKYITTAASGTNGAESIGFNDAEGLVFRSYKVERTNPNDSWNKTTANVIVKDGTALVADGILFQSDVLTQSKKYKLEFDVASLNAGSGAVRFRNNDGSLYTISSNGHHVYEFTHAIANAELQFEATASNSSAVLSNITLKEITNSVKDFSPNNNNGVLYSGKCLQFDQANNYIDIDYWASKTIDANTKATFTTWVNSQDVAPGHYIFGAWTVVNTALFYLGVKDRKLDLGWGDSGWTGSVTSGALPTMATDTWYRVVAVVDGLTCKVYLNGEFVFSKKNSNSFVINSEGISIGAQGDDRGDHFYGELADFQIYNKAWTPSDVTYDYNNPDKDVFDDEGRAEVLGAELVGNGNFTNDIQGWAAKNSTISYDNGKLKVSGTGNESGGAYQNIGLVTGKYYKMTATIKLLTASSSGTFTLLTSLSNGTDQTTVYTGSTLVAGGDAVTETFIFTPGTGDVSIQLSSDESNADFTIDNVSVKEVLTHAGEISPTDCTALYRLNEGAGNRLYNAAPVLGANLIGNSDFSSDVSGWFTGGSGTIDHVASFGGRSNVAKITTPTTYNISNKVYHTFTAIPNAIYEVKLDVYVVSGQFRVDGSNSDLTGEAGLQDIIHQGVTSGWVTVSGIATGGSGADASTQLWIRAQSNSSDLECYVDNISVKQITLSESYIQEAWASDRWVSAQPYIPQYAMSSYSKKMIFDGVDDYIQLGTDNITIPAANPFSFSFWYYNIDEATDQIVLGKDGDSNQLISIDDGNKGIRFKVTGSSDANLSFDNTLTKGKLNHIVLTNAGGSTTDGLKCYVNGILQSDTENSLNVNFGFRHICNSVSQFGKGFIDELAHFSKELSATEVQEIFNAGIALDCRDHSAFLGDEEFDDPGFDDPSEWGNLGNGWVVSGGKASVDTSSTVEITQTLSGVTAGKIYDISFEISDFSHGAFQFAHGRFHDVETSASIPNISGNGTYSYRTIAQGSDPFFMYLYAYNASKFSIDNISVKEVQLNGYWRNNGAETWYDLSPYGNDGTVNGSPTTIQLQEVPYFKKDTFGLPMNKVRQKGLNLDGDSYVEINKDSSLDFGTSDFSFECWVKYAYINQGSGWNAILHNGINDGSGTGFGLVSNSSRFAVRLNDGSHQTEFIGSGLTQGQWYHVVVTRSGTTLKTYLDAEEETHTILSVDVTTTTPLRVGRDVTSDRYYTDLVDDIKLYSKELSASEVSRNFKATKSKHKNNTISNWSDDFDDGFI